jgi:hypothetical protein
MPEITFNDNNNFKYKSRVILGQPKVPNMSKFLVGKGIVKNEKQALFIMLAFTGLMIISTVLTIYLGFFKQPKIDIPVQEVELPVNIEQVQ